MLKQIIRPFQYKSVLNETQAQQGVETNDSMINSPATQHANKKKMKAQNWADTLKRIWSYLAENKWRLIFVLLLVVVSSAMALLGPFLVGMTIDDFIVTHDNSGILKLLVVLLIIYLIHSSSVWLQNYFMVGIAQNTVYTMRSKLFKHLHKLPIPYFDKRQHGELMSRVTNDIENVSQTLNTSVIQIFASVLTLLGTISVMLWLSPLLTLITLIIVPLMVLGMKWITKRTGKLFKQQQKHLGELNGYIEETVSGQRIIKTFSQENTVINEFVEKSNRLRTAGFWAQTYSGFIPKLMNMLNNLSFAIIAGVGGVFVLLGVNAISIGVIVIFAEYARQFTRPLNDLANQFNTLLSAVAGAERVFDVLDEEEEESDETKAIQLDEVHGEVQFDNVSFSYDSADNGKKRSHKNISNQNQTVQNINFTARRGETIAFVGPTGAGKTTMINLLSRFYDAQQGKILIDGYDITQIKRHSLRKHMGFVLQDTFLFEGTIKENIRYGNLKATDEEVVEAAKKANAHTFIMKMPNQYKTVLKQDGSGISQGQKQLLAIARAILANPTILILDEATSSIDTITEMKIQEALQRLMVGRTSFVIAHRLNTIQKADQIIVLGDGKIVEKGSHDSLLKQRGFYYELYTSQLSDSVI